MRFTLSLFCFGFLWQGAAGQSVAVGPDSSRLTAARQAILRYEQVSHTDERLYDGPEYISYDRRLTGHAFYPTDTLQEGQVAYKGGLFTVPMLYDIVKDVVVVVHTSGYRMTLHSDRVPRFSLRNHTFIRLDSTGQEMQTGFYDLLYDGPTQLLARRTKVVLVNPTSFGYGLYDPKTTYFIRKNGHYTPVKNKRAFLALLGDHRKQLATYARQQKIRFRPSPETAFLKLTQYYDGL